MSNWIQNMTEVTWTLWEWLISLICYLIMPFFLSASNKTQEQEEDNKFLILKWCCNSGEKFN